MTNVVDFDKYRIQSYVDKVLKSTEGLDSNNPVDCSTIFMDALDGFEDFMDDKRYTLSIVDKTCKIRFLDNEIVIKPGLVEFHYSRIIRSKIVSHEYDTKTELVISLVWFLFATLIDKDNMIEFSSPDYKVFRDTYIV